MFNKEGLLPVLNEVRSEDPATQALFAAIKETLEIYRGDRGDPLNKVVTLRDFVNTSTADQYLTKAGSPSSLTELISQASNFTPPNQVQNLQAAGAMANIILTWDAPLDNYSYTEIWRSATDDLGTAVIVGTSVAAIYNDTVGDGGRYYYWVRAVNSGNTAGPYNATTGTLGETSYDPTYVLDMLTVKWKASTAYTLNSYVIPTPASEGAYWYKCTTAGNSGTSEPTWPTTIGQTVNDGTVVWETVAASTEYPPFEIGEVDGSPVVVMNSAFIGDAAITTAKIKDAAIDTAKIADAQITAAKIGTAAITEAKIADAAIVAAKIATAAITEAKIAAAAITTAKIADAQITAAKIGTAEVDTLKLAGQAVTIPLGVSGASSWSFSVAAGDSGWHNYMSGTIAATGNPHYVVATIPPFSLTYSWGFIQVIYIYVEFIVDGTVLASKSKQLPWDAEQNGLVSGSVDLGIISYYHTPAAGNRTYTVRVKVTGVPVGTSPLLVKDSTVVPPTMYVSETKR